MRTRELAAYSFHLRGVGVVMARGRPGRTRLGLRLLVVGAALAAKPADPTGSYFRKGRRVRLLSTYFYVCARSTCFKNTQRMDSYAPQSPPCFCGSSGMLWNKLVEGDFAPLTSSQDVWVCISCQEPPVRSESLLPEHDRPGHLFKRFATRS